MTDRQTDRQTDGRRKNGAAPGDKPDTPDAKVRKTGRAEQKSAGPDGPDPTETTALIWPPEDRDAPAQRAPRSHPPRSGS